MFAEKCLWFVLVGFIYFVIGQLLTSGDLAYFALSVAGGVALTLYLPKSYKKRFAEEA
ncbi:MULTISPECIES: hypothetical protein [Gammaproteobacteria]|jgi:hypothetical protein|uniref:Uncharacterized protein n=2 Tax=Gammaproteobacteria TaxID=1236 RepID=A0A6F8XCY0_9GAMM|nr:MULTISPECIES: hypothetical protein [Gammaproteobacteria]MCZ4128805.1 hypothetical protein [Stutzerimonas balearica]MDS0773399.1 hypothetical protein [Escherichia coli]MDT3795471.1 hypothetical protein [Escherichia coli]NWN90406.1 hypothetical protein [Marinobacter adhaerens]BCB72096.1 hypothetical protein HMEPL2_24470 [Halomonas meridiana]|tara:strand:+ start:230 stop:403 length:174 start_codon:yes stop_codon:yes gene_type:complete